jgi:hypothetical protein
MKKITLFQHFIYRLIGFIIFLTVYALTSLGQSIGINATGAAPNNSAFLDISSTEQGILIPRLTDVQRQAIKDPANGLMIYNLTTNEINFYSGSSWERLTANSVSVTSAGGSGPGGGIGINNTGLEPHASAILDISSSEKGLLIPRANRSSFTSIEGVLIFNTDNDLPYFFNGSRWTTPCQQTTIDNTTGVGALSEGIAFNTTGIGGDPSAILDISSATKGILLPRMTPADRDAIKSPAVGLIIYNTTDNRMEYWMGTDWMAPSETGEGFKTEWTVLAGESITLPLNSGNGSAFNCTVDWGDGSNSNITAFDDLDITHNYTLAGTYTVEIIGQCEGWSFNNSGDRLKITDIISWGDPCKFDGFKYLEAGFYGCSNLASLPSGSILASEGGCDNFFRTFYNCTSLTGSIPTGIFDKHTLISSRGFFVTFTNCSGLTGAIPSGLFDNNTLVSSSGFASTFEGCSGLTGSIPAGLFDNNTLVSSSGFESTFEGCSGLTGSIPAGLFDNNTLVSNDGFQETFVRCSGLTGAIPSGLFDNNPLVSASGFFATFERCSGLTGAIPAGLFDNNPLVTTFFSTFDRCSGLTGAIPAGLFDNNPLVSSSGFRETFSRCSGLTSIPAGLFDFNTQVSSSAFYRTFYRCTGILGAIPPSLFDNNNLVSSSGFRETFHGCTGLTGPIPVGFFDNNTAVSSSGFYRTFYGCIGLTGSIPTGLFDNNPSVSSNGFRETFYNCISLTGTIPTGLFDNNPAVSSSGFYRTFAYCSGLTGSIPTGLFDNNTLVSSSGFYGTFQVCSGLTGSIPAGLFDNNTAVSSSGFSQTFSGCTGLTGVIPSGLFDNNTLVSSNGFSFTFSNCSGLTGVIPSGLFRNNIFCTSFYGTFEGCTSLQLNRNIFYADGEESTRFFNQSVFFTDCFDRSSYSGAIGEAPELWNCDFGTGSPASIDCYNGAGNSTTSLSNYPDELITLDVSPATEWVSGDIITGQTSGTSCIIVSRITATTYIINSRGGIGYTLGEIIGVTGVPSKLADQGAASPTFTLSGWR